MAYTLAAMVFGMDFTELAPWVVVGYTILQWLARLVMFPIILRRRFSPATSLAWLALIFFTPEIGLICYLLIGGTRLGARRAAIYKRVRESTQARTGELWERSIHSAQPELDDAYRPMMLLAEQIGGMSILGGNEVEILGDTNGLIDRIVADIDSAKHHVHLLYYIFEPDETGHRIAEALMRAHDRGVVCRLLADAAGARSIFRFDGLAERLNAHGVKTLPMLPVSLWRIGLRRIDVRNHRKLAVIDGHIAYTGSHNIVNASYGHNKAGEWHDLTGRFTGPIVAQLQQVFVEDWSCESDIDLQDDPHLFPSLASPGQTLAQVVPTAPLDEELGVVPQVMLAAMNAATHKLLITTPYLVPDEATLMALVMAAARGVQVDIVVPQRGDHAVVAAAGRHYFEELLSAGVRIHEHRDGLLHAKTMTVDDAFALLGTTNLDIRSFQINFELNVLMYGPQITGRLRYAQSAYLNEATRVDLKAWRRRPRRKRVIESAAALLSPLL